VETIGLKKKKRDTSAGEVNVKFCVKLPSSFSIARLRRERLQGVK
jgi:hypothetical protein